MAIGWGMMGIGTHAELAMGPALNTAAGTKFAAVCSRSMDRAKAFALKHSAERVYDSYEKMLEDPELDVVYIATPNSLHSSQTIQAAEAGKHVLCEKPMALTVAEADLMVQTCERNKVKLGVCFQNRYHPVHLEARRYIHSGAAGPIDVARAQFCRGRTRGYWQGWRNDPQMSGSGALLANGVHPVDLLRFLLSSEVEEVRALTDEDPPSRPVEDMVYVILKFENGTNGVVISGILAPRSKNDIILYGTEAKVTCKGVLGGTSEHAEFTVQGKSFNMSMNFSSDHPVREKYVRVVEAFNQWIEDDTEPFISGANGLKMVKIASAILESSHQGRAVKLR